MGNYETYLRNKRNYLMGLRLYSDIVSSIPEYFHQHMRKYMESIS